MNKKILYTTKLQAGLGMIEETQVLLEIWQPGMKATELLQKALSSGNFPNVSARRLRNLVLECFAPRYLISGDYPAILLKNLGKNLSLSEYSKLLLLFTSRANLILEDFIKTVYWRRYSSGYESINNNDAQEFVIQANQEGKTTQPWSESTIKRVSGYLLGCCIDFGMLEPSKRGVRKIIPFNIEPIIIVLLAYDLHFSGIGDNSILSHSDWELFGLQRGDVRAELKRLSFKGFFIIQSAGEITCIGWKYKSWEELINDFA